MNAAEIRVYLDVAIASFGKDPAQNDFQRGYLAALEAIQEDCFMTQQERTRARAVQP